MTELLLRPYQQRAIDAVWRAWTVEGLQRPAGIAPTGAGKTVMFSAIARQAIDRGCRRVGVLVHREELIEQSVAKLRSAAPDVRVGVVAAGRDDTSARIIVAGVQTASRQKRLDRLRNVELWIVDEAHHVPAPTYQAVLRASGCFDPGGAKALGVTATMVRADKGKLGDTWERLAFEIGIVKLIRDGFLVKPRGIHVRVVDLDLDRVKTARGDFSDGDLGRAMEDSPAPAQIVEAVQEHAADRKGVWFGPTVAFGHLMAQRFNEAGLRAAVVSGQTPKDERRATLAALASGEIRWVWNCAVLTEGTDIPSIDCVGIARPTKSAGLFTQMVGRGLRPAPGKEDCLVLDVAGATRKHKLAGLASLARTEDEPAVDRMDSFDDDLEGEEEDLGDLLGYDDDVVEGLEDFADEVRGTLVSEFIDLFDSSHSAWLQTRGGTWFLPLGKDFLAIVPDQWNRRGWAVIRLGATHGHSSWIAGGIEEMSYAMAHGEQAVSAAEMMYVVKGKEWRKGKVTPAQIEMAGRWGMRADAIAGLRRGELSDLISIEQGSARIDPYINAMARY